MTFINYNLDIPDGPNNPSVDQPKMKVNTNSIDQILDIDHFSFEENNGGLHRQVTLPLRGGSPGTIPPGRAANEGTLYTKTANTTTQLFYTPDNSTNEYQLTRTNSAGIALFGANTTNYGGAIATFLYSGGWTFLPGGLLMQYGVVYGANGGGVYVASTLPITGTIPFPIAFTTEVRSITFEIRRDSVVNDSSATAVSRTTPPSTTNFTYVTATSTSDALYWSAIGV